MIISQMFRKRPANIIKIKTCLKHFFLWLFTLYRIDRSVTNTLFYKLLLGCIPGGFFLQCFSYEGHTFSCIETHCCCLTQLETGRRCICANVFLHEYERQNGSKAWCNHQSPYICLCLNGGSVWGNSSQGIR